MPSDPTQSWLAGVEKILNAKTRNLRELAELAGLDPKVMYIGTAIDGADLRGQDLRGMTFTHLDRTKVRLDENTRLDDEAPTPEDDGQVFVLILIFDFEWSRAFLELAQRAPVRIVVYQAQDTAIFWRDAIDHQGPVLVIAGVQDEIWVRRNWRPEVDAMQIMPIEGSSKLIADLGMRFDGSGPPTIFVPLHGADKRTRQTVGGAVSTLRDVVTIAAAWWPEVYQAVSRQWLTYVSVSREVADDRENAWYRLYGKAAKLGVVFSHAQEMVFSRGGAKSASFDLLFPDASSFNVPSNPSWPSFDAAALGTLLPISGREAEEDYERAAGRMLRANGWEIIFPDNTHDAAKGLWPPDFNVHGPNLGLSVTAQIRIHTMGKIWPAANAWTLDDVVNIVVSETADANTVLGCMLGDRRLVVNLQDLRWLNGDATSLWPLVAHQARRLSRTLGGQARTLYFTSLLRTAVAAGRVNLEASADLIERLRTGDVDQGSLALTTVSHNAKQVVFEAVLSQFFREGPAHQALFLVIDDRGPSIYGGASEILAAVKDRAIRSQSKRQRDRLARGDLVAANEQEM